MSTATLKSDDCIIIYTNLIIFRMVTDDMQLIKNVLQTWCCHFKIKGKNGTEVINAFAEVSGY